MPDREKVIKGLHCCSHTDGVNCIYCPYDISDTDCTALMAMDVLALLKEQEAVEPIPPTDESDLWKCGNCNHQLFRCTHQRYCDMCGKKVKWE